MLQGYITTERAAQLIRRKSPKSLSMWIARGEERHGIRVKRVQGMVHEGDLLQLFEAEATRPKARPRKKTRKGRRS